MCIYVCLGSLQPTLALQIMITMRITLRDIVISDAVKSRWTAIGQNQMIVPKIV